MRLVYLSWKLNGDYGEVTYTKQFDEESPALQLDLINDCIYQLQEKYDYILKHGWDEWDLKMKENVE